MSELVSKTRQNVFFSPSFELRYVATVFANTIKLLMLWVVFLQNSEILYWENKLDREFREPKQQSEEWSSQWIFRFKQLERSLKKSELWRHTLGARSVGRALHRYCGGHGFESRWSPDFFRLLSNCLNWKIYCDDYSSLSSSTAVQIWIISYKLSIIKQRSHNRYLDWSKKAPPGVTLLIISTVFQYFQLNF